MITLSTHQKDILNEFILLEVSKTMLTRGKSILKRVGKIEMGDDNFIAASVKGSGGGFYKVEFQINEKTEVAHAVCNCLYFLENYQNCKHIAAVAFSLITNDSNVDLKTKESAIEKLLNEGLVKKGSSVNNNTIENRPVLGMELAIFNLPDYWSLPVHNNATSKARSVYTNKSDYVITMSDGGKRFDMLHKKGLSISFVHKKNKKNQLVVGCNCAAFEAKEPCCHIWGLLLILNDNNDRFYFRQFEDYTAEKNALIAEYGITIEDELAKEFKFTFDYRGELLLSDKPKGLLPLFSVTNTEWKQITNQLPIKKIKTVSTEFSDQMLEVKIKTIEPFDMAVLINLNKSAINGFRIDSFKITQKGDKFSYTNLKLKTKEDLAVFENAPTAMQNALLNITEESLIKLLRDNTNAYNVSATQPFRGLREDQMDLIDTEYRNSLKQLAPYLSEWKHLYYLEDTLNFTKTNVKPCKFVDTPLDYKIVLEQSEKTISLSIKLYDETTDTIISNYTSHKYLILCNDTFYFMPTGINKIKKYMPQGKLVAPINAKHEFINQIVLPLTTQFEIDLGGILKTESIAGEPEPRIYLKELNEKYLMIMPKWLYGEYEMDNDKETLTTLELGDGILKIERKPHEEKKLVENLRKLHPSFLHQNNEYFYLHFDEVMKKNWFLMMYKELQEMDIPIFGMNNLKRFKYNTNVGKMEFKTGSGTDWFDIRITVSYGDEIVPLATLRKAIINKQDFVLLNDGTLGMLPEEWIKKFATLMRLGTIKEDAMQVSKLHWTVIDQLHEQIDEEDILKEILLKKERLKDIDNVKKLKLPNCIKATMRDYQKSGFQWMNILDDMGWGGCLADDMGLGKTLQTLAFLSAMQLKHKGETHLIVCPTSLIYNWQTEIDKFTPNLTYYIHYGAGRELNDKDIADADIVITSYGMLRSDIEELVMYRFGYLILDESQAIKNHLSQTAKAAHLINSRNRLILSGTPVQNNTFDLFAQFNFINPGLLGNVDFFKTEFANKIDKENDKEKTEELRRLIYPFMLRRTKEQVAKDLPEKTETILWCEMEGKQRTIYNSFKEDYRKTILKKIEEEGFAKAGIFILSGLTKLRQICDSPAILNEDEAYPNVSIKIEELMREIEENSSNHKALIFSQFTSMLGLIGKELDKQKIPYYYLDGSTKATDRQKAVANFQDNDAVRIFLVSLKAGGVGLNLTAADYVYMVDPWWNPAVEQQAIDRTHRIGQKKNVFAYKLICKDSIEEKILLLQQKKKSLSADLISDENGFVKKLTKDDVAYLFS